MSGFTKLFSSIVTSTIWIENDPTLRVWIAMLATPDADGVVEGSIPGFASLARVTVDQMRAVVTKLSSPDPDSRTPDNEGRRIEVIEGGWRILNYRSHRDRGQAKDGSRAPAQRAYRARIRAVAASKDGGNALPNGVTRYTEAEAEAEARSKRAEEQKSPRLRRPAIALPRPQRTEFTALVGDDGLRRYLAWVADRPATGPVASAFEFHRVRFREWQAAEARARQVENDAAGERRTADFITKRRAKLAAAAGVGS